MIPDLRRSLLPLEPLPPHPTGPKPSAVLISILPGAPCRLLMVLRSRLLRSHAGQVAFPGGVRDAADPDLRTTALRETQEELGIPPATVDLLGCLPPVHTLTGYWVLPLVGVLTTLPDLHPNPAEVERVLTPTLQELLEQPPRSLHVRLKKGRRSLSLPVFQAQGERVWGATALMLRELLTLMDRSRFNHQEIQP